jgi:hypothetical protein
MRRRESRAARHEAKDTMNEPSGKNPAPGARPSEPASDAARKAARRKRLDERLDEALEETFPASDPIAVHEPRKDAPPR